MNVLVVTKKSPEVVKLIMGFHHRSLEVVELMMENHYGNLGVMRLELRPHHIDSYICVSKWMASLTKETNDF